MDEYPRVEKSATNIGQVGLSSTSEHHHQFPLRRHHLHLRGTQLHLLSVFIDLRC